MQGRALCLLVSALLLCVQLPLAASQDAGSKNSSKINQSQIISLAPPGDLVNGNDDVSQAGSCAAELKQFCQDIAPGEGRLANCLSDKIAESESPDGSDDASPVSDACREEVYQYKIHRSTNINLNLPLAKACKADAEKHCNVSWFFGYKTGNIISCLRGIKDELSPACKKMVFRVQLDAAEDYRADAALFEACKPDADRLCPDVKPGGGRIQACLRERRPELAWPCEEQLFRQEVENADDIRLSVRLFANCMADKRRFCADVEPGATRVKDCLEEHRKHPAFSKSCRAELDDMIERRVHDFRLDTRLRTSCAEVLHKQCAFYGEDLNEENTRDGSLIRCLQDFVDEITDPVCKQQVLKYKELAAEDVRFNVPLATACYQDRQSYCGHVPPGSARVIRCLMKQRDKLTPPCRAVLFDEEVRFSENIDFQYPMRQACTRELEAFCKDVPHGEARAIRCLQDHKADKDFGKECAEQVRLYEQEASADYRLNYRLAKNCKKDINALCASVCKAEEGQVCGGQVLRCLIDKREEITDSQCKHEVFYFEKMEVTDYRNDLILAAACRGDVEKFCSQVEPGEGRVHDCLRKHSKQLSQQCAKEELLLEELEAENVELRPGVMRVCKDERHMFCKGVAPGAARMFRCLAEKMGDADFGEACRSEITSKLLRRQANWKLDPLLRKACKAAVREMCIEVERDHQEQGQVYKCLISKYDDLPAPCQKELGRALHMAFFIWTPQQILTQACDNDIQQQCLAQRPSMGNTPGAVGQCVSAIVDEMAAAESADRKTQLVGGKQPRSLSEPCRLLADIAQPPDAKKAFDSSLFMLQSQLQAVQGATGLKMVHTDRRGNAHGITLTGWTAVLGMAAMVVLLVWGTGFAWKRYQGLPEKEYTLVVKKSHR